MSDLSFSDAKKSTLSTQALILDKAFDDKLKMNRIISHIDGKPNSTIFSINPNQVLRKITGDDLSSLLKLTLACRQTRDGVGIWDVLYNLVNKEALTACIFTAKSDYSPIGQDRVVTFGKFLDYRLAISRLHLNQVDNGDKIGIGIYDFQQNLSYVLLYSIVGNCLVPHGEQYEEGRPMLIPAINVQMEKLYRVHPSGEADVVDVIEDAPELENEKKFVEWIVNSVNNIETSYSWKPHFLPQGVAKFDREEIEARLLTDIEEAPLSSYEAFEEACRKVYDDCRNHKPAPKKRRVGQPFVKGAAPVPKLPVIEVTTLSDQAIVARVADRLGFTSQLFKIEKEDLEKASATETFLLNKDLEGQDLNEVSKILMLTQDKFGENSLVRYFTLNF